MLIFRGNNRNRRRGFHNTHVFYSLIDRALAGDATSLTSLSRLESLGPAQLVLSLS